MKYRINYEKVISQADTIADTADDLRRQVDQIINLEEQCRSVWKGKAASIFVNKLQSLRMEMNRTRIQMNSLAETVRFCADRIQKADQMAEEKAAELKTSYK